MILLKSFFILHPFPDVVGCIARSREVVRSSLARKRIKFALPNLEYLETTPFSSTPERPKILIYCC